MLPELEKTQSDLSLDGLEPLLEKSEAEGSADDIERLQDWTVDEAARVLGLSKGAVIRRLEDGIIPGYRVRRGFGHAWRVKPVWLGEPSVRNKQETEPACSKAVLLENERNTDEANSESENSAKEYVDVFEISDESSYGLSATSELIEVRSKLQLVEKQLEEAQLKLDGANYKLGYLEARLEFSQEQLRLLKVVDEATPSLFSRFKNWFCSSR